jgi:hypothetical protein
VTPLEMLAELHVELTPAVRDVAAVVESVTASQQERAVLVALGWHESRFAHYVLEGRCEDGPRGARCDAGMARGPWQVHRWCRAAWAVEDGTPEALRAGAACALRAIRTHAARCASEARTVLDGAFAGYATGHACAWRGSAARVQTTRRLLAAEE